MAFQLCPIQSKLTRLLSLYAGVRNLQYKCRSCRDDRVISKSQNKMAVAYYNIDQFSLLNVIPTLTVNNILCVIVTYIV